MKIFLVGGAVRDTLLQREVTERDWVVVGAKPNQLLEQGFLPVGKDFPVFLHPKTKEEYALARTERKSGSGYTGFECYAAEDVTLEEDLIRRDLTINAIAQDENGILYDPYNGQQDLTNRILRHVSEAFAEDPVRILRIARFAARYHRLGFSIAPSTLLLMKSMVNNGEVDHLVPERVWKEMSRALEEDHPEVFFQVLRHCGALKKVLPELDRLFGVPQPAQHHPEIDTGVHALLSLKAAVRESQSLPTRFAALMHDLGKGLTPKDNWPSHHGHEKLGLDAIRAVCARLAVPNPCRDLALLTAEFHTDCHRAFELRPDTLLKKLERLDVLRRPERFDEFLIACRSDSRGRTGLENVDYPQKEYMSAAVQALASITAKDVLTQHPESKGPDIGLHLKRLRTEALSQLKKTYST